MSFIRRPTPVTPSREPNIHRSGPPTVSPRRHHQKEEDPHLYTKERQQEQSLSNYAQQDLSVMAQMPQN
jgi:hypothetical protein